MLLVIDYLKQNGLEALMSTYHISAKRHGTYPNLVLLKYDQIDSPMGEKIVQECRGLILDETNNWIPVCFPYSKFFNVEEGHAAQIDWNSAKVLEKLDGSIISLYFYNGKWHVSTSGTPDANAPVNKENLLFVDLFWSVWKELEYSMPINSNVCYMFELMTKENRIVVPHAKNRLVLHGARDMQTLKELKPQFIAANHGWECVKAFPLRTLEDVLVASKLLNPMECEGYVVCDTNFNRVKIKSPQYVALHHIKSNLSNRRMLEIILANEGAEFLSYFPELRPLYDGIKSKYDTLHAEIEATYNKFAHIENQKEFALQVKDLPYSFVCFSLRSKKDSTIRSILQDCSIQRIEKLFNITNEPFVKEM